MDDPHDDSKQREFLRLFLQSEREIYRSISVKIPNRNDAEEVVQEAALTLFKKFDQYDRDRRFTPWACGVALNVAKQWLERQTKWRAVLDDQLATELTQRRTEIADQLNSRLEYLESCLPKLPSRKLQVIGLYYFKRLSVAKIAESIDRSTDAVYRMLQRARHDLQQCIQKQKAEPT